MLNFEAEKNKRQMSKPQVLFLTTDNAHRNKHPKWGVCVFSFLTLNASALGVHLYAGILAPQCVSAWFL